MLCLDLKKYKFTKISKCPTVPTNIEKKLAQNGANYRLSTKIRFRQINSQTSRQLSDLWLISTLIYVYTCYLLTFSNKYNNNDVLGNKHRAITMILKYSIIILTKRVTSAERLGFTLEYLRPKSEYYTATF